ncbi:MAG: aminotransferase class I/II-fold pyridoxal phosphate-dependent enzyme, partial [Acidobacteria bacterium]|nr:aminotransferase class I/II-fold pyridoxal phosphate-dependent enzyme [Acidobacteriota bacterium]
KPKHGLSTRAVQTYSDGEKRNRSLTTPLLQTVTFQSSSSRELGELFKSATPSVYTRFGHPTLAAAGEKIAALEGAEAGLVFSSGMAAISTALMATLRPGDRVVAQREIFGQTFTFLDRTLRAYGVETEFVAAADSAGFERAVQKGTKLLYIESPSNPLIRVVDIAARAQLAHRAGALLFIDGTFASPAIQNPLALGADLVLHSATKYLSGHSDVLCGAAAGSAALIRQLREMQILLGGVLDPHAAWLLLRGIKTLDVRVERQSATALRIAQFLAGREEIASVNYPWLETSPTFEIARRQMRAGGGMLSFEVAGGLKGARAFVDALEIVPIATSLGGVESLIEIPYELDFSEEELGEAAQLTGIAPGLVRLSVGIETPEDLLADLELGLGAVRERGFARTAQVAAVR